MTFGTRAPDEGTVNNPDGNQTERKAECPVCGETVAVLGNHLRRECDGIPR